MGGNAPLRSPRPEEKKRPPAPSQKTGKATIILFVRIIFEGDPADQSLEPKIRRQFCVENKATGALLGEEHRLYSRARLGLFPQSTRPRMCKVSLLVGEKCAFRQCDHGRAKESRPSAAFSSVSVAAKAQESVTVTPRGPQTVKRRRQSITVCLARLWISCQEAPRPSIPIFL